MTTRLLNALNKTSKLALGLAGCAAATVIAYAAVSYDPLVGGFAGKGDVQLAFGWNNAALQKNAQAVRFRFVETVTTSWVCEHYVYDKKVEDYDLKNSNTKTSISGVDSQLDGDPRQIKGQKQFTGFILDAVKDEASITDGPRVGSCPAPKSDDDDNSYWLLKEGSIVTQSEGSGLQVSINGTDWIDLPNTPML